LQNVRVDLVIYKVDNYIWEKIFQDRFNSELYNVIKEDTKLSELVESDDIYKYKAACDLMHILLQEKLKEFKEYNTKFIKEHYIPRKHDLYGIPAAEDIKDMYSSYGAAIKCVINGDGAVGKTCMVSRVKTQSNNVVDNIYYKFISRRLYSNSV
jgi:hypothetical protein